MINACFLARFDNSTIHMTHLSNFYSMKVYVEKTFNIFFYSSFSCILYWCNIKTYYKNTTYSKKYNFIDFKFVRWVRLLTAGGYFWCFCFLYFRHLWSNASRSIMITLFIHVQIGYFWEWFFSRIFDSILQLSYR